MQAFDCATEAQLFDRGKLLGRLSCEENKWPSGRPESPTGARSRSSSGSMLRPCGRYRASLTAMNEKKSTYRVEIKNIGTPPNETFGWNIYRNQDVLPILRSQQLFVSRAAGLTDANRSRLQLIDADALGRAPQSTGQ
jgi:hypothetical protein